MRRPRLQLESLEPRLAPAFDLTVGGATLTGVTRTIVGASVAASYEATAAGANLPWANISADLQAGLDVVITSGSTGTQAGNVTVNPPPQLIGLGSGRTLVIATGSGTNFVGDITIGNVPLAATNLSLFVGADRNLAIGQLGDVTASQPIFAQLSAGGAITGGIVSARDLQIFAGSGIGTAASPLGTVVTNLGARTNAAGAGIWLTEQNDLRLANLNGTAGVQTNNGPIVLRTSNGDLDTNGLPVSSGTGPIDILLGGTDSVFDNTSGTVTNANAPIRIRADDMNLGSGSPRIATNSAGRVELGPTRTTISTLLGSISSGGGALRLSDAELDTIATPLLQIGDTASGAIAVGDPLSQTKNLLFATRLGVSGSGSITNGSGTPITLTIDQAGASTFSGAIGGPAAGPAADRAINLIKLGAGALTFTGANTYSGTTAIGAGALLVDGSTGPGSVTVQPGGTLGGTGQVGGSVSVQVDGTLSPGSGGAGTLGIGGGLTFQVGSTFLVDVGPGAACDSVTAAGPITVADGVNLLGTVTGSLVPGTYALIVPTPVTVTGGGFRDANGTRTPLPSGGPIVVGGQRFNYAFNSGGVGFGLVARGTAVVLDTGNLTVTDTGSQDDNLFVSLVGNNLRIHDPDNGMIAGPGVTLVDANTIEVPLAAVTGELVLDTRAGNDAATFLLTPNSLPAGGARFEAGTGTNRIAVQGTAAISATYTPLSARPMDGLFQLPGRSLRYTAASAVDVSGLGGLTFRSPGGADDLVIDEGFDAATRAIPALVLSGTSGGVPMRPVSVWGVGTLTIDTAAADGADTVTVFGAANGHGIGGLTVLTGVGADALTVSGAATFTGNLLFDTQAIALNALVRFGTSATLDAGTGPITSTAALALAGNSVVMTGAAIGTAASPIQTSVIRLQATATAGSVFVTNQGGLTLAGVTSAGDVVIEADGLSLTDPLTATGRAVQLRATAGSITGGGAVRAASLLVIATDGIDLDTAVDSLTAATTVGGIAIANAGALALNSIFVRTSGDIAITAGGAITLNGTVEYPVANTATLDAGAGPITASVAGTAVTGGALVLKGSAIGTAATPIQTSVISLQATATAGGVFVTDQGGLTLAGVEAAGDVAISAGGMDLIAPLTATGRTVTLTATAGGITGLGTTLKAASLVATGSGGILLDTDVASLEASSGLGPVNVTNVGALDVAGTGVRSGGSIRIIAGGAITSSVAGTAVTGTALVLSGTAIGTAASPIQTAVVTLQAVATAGGVFVTDQGALTLAGVVSAGDVAITAGSLDVSAALTATDRVVTLRATAGAISGVGVIQAANLVANASAGIQVNTDVDLLTASTGAGAITVVNDGALTLNGVMALTFGDVTITAGGAIASADGTLVTGGALALTGTAIGTAASPIQTAVTSLQAIATAGGVFVTDQGALTLLGVVSAGDVAITAGSLNLSFAVVALGQAVTLTATAGAIGGPGAVRAASLVASATTGIQLTTFLGTLTATTGTGGIAIANNGALTLARVEVATSGDVTLTADAMAVNGTVRGPGAVSLTVADQAGAGQNIVVAAGVPLSAGAALTLSAGDDLTVGAGATLTGATIVLRVDAGNADAGVGGTATLIGATLTGPATLNGHTDDDTFDVAPAVLAVEGAGGTDRLTLTTGDAAQVIELNGSRISGGAGFDVTYTSTGGGFGRGVVLTTGAGGDKVTVSGTSWPTTVSTLGGADTIVVSGPNGLAAILAAGLTLDAGSGVNTFEASDETSAVGGTYTLEAGSVTGPGFTLLYVATGGSFGLVRVTASAFADRIRVVSKGADRVIAQGAGGEDLFEVSVGVNSPPTGIEVDGGAGRNALRTIDTTGGALIRNVPSGPRSGKIQVSYVINTATEYAYRNIARVLGIDPFGNYIIALFRHTLGRNPSAAEKARWSAVLRRRGRLVVARTLATSPQGRLHLVRFWYQVFKGRAPTAVEEAPLVRLLRLGRSEESVLGVILGSRQAPYQTDVRTKLVEAYFQDRLRRVPAGDESPARVRGTQTLQGLRLLIDIDREFYTRGL